MSMREKDSSDFDLELFIDLFDEALTSDDPSVQKTLQHLMVITALARNHAKHDRFEGPLRRLFDNVHNLNRRLDRLESENARRSAPGYPGGGSVPLGPSVPSPTTWPGGGGPLWPPQPGTYPPGTIWGQSTSVTWPDSGGKSMAGYGAIPPLTATQVNDLLKDEKYKGSTLGTTDVKTA